MTGKKCVLFFLFTSILNVGLSQIDERSTSDFRKGKLDEQTYNEVIGFLNKYSNEIKDTILIRYHYNNGACWIIMDKTEGEEEIRSRIKYGQEHLKKAMEARPQLSFFEFREPGNRANKIIKWNNEIIIDTTKTLHRLLFSKEQRCGNSAMILPDRRFIFLQSDPHNEMILHPERTATAIKDLLE